MENKIKYLLKDKVNEGFLNKESTRGKIQIEQTSSPLLGPRIGHASF